MITEAELAELLSDIESDRVEMTRSLTDANKFGEAICAFANDLPNHRRPGYLVVGVDDTNRVPSGAVITDQLLQNLASFRDSGQIAPLPSLNIAKLRFQGADVAVAEVFPSVMPPVRYKGRVHVRVGPRRAIATIEEERRLTERRVDQARTWDAQACPGSTLDDLALDLFKLAYLPKARRT